MTTAEIDNIYSKTASYIRRGRLSNAFTLIINTAEGAMLWEISDAAKRAAENYRYILQYLTNDANDPQRPQMVTRATLEAWHLLDLLARHLRRPMDGTLYYNTLRTLGKQRLSLGKRLEDYRRLSGNDAVFAERDIFNHIWVAFPLAEETSAVITDALASSDLSHRLKAQIVAAIGLGLTEAFDRARIDILLSLYSDIDTPEPLKLQALMWLLVALYKYRDRPLPIETADALSVIADLPEWGPNIRSIFLAFIQARNTEQVTRQMKEEIIPGMMSARNDIMAGLKNIDPSQPVTPEDIEENPEWREMLENTGIADRLKRLSELQEQGGDIYMATFGNLKNFPFFTPPAAWFTPFEGSSPELADNGIASEAAEVIASMPFLCDTDKFSMALSMKMLPPEQYRMLTQNLEASRDMFKEQTASILDDTPELSARIAVTNAVRNLYRFNYLFRRKTEFYNPFADGFNLLDVPALAGVFDSPELLQVVAELFLQLGYYADAAVAFARLDALAGPDSAVLEKLAYAYHRLGNYRLAAETYHQAEAFTPDKPWLQKRLAEVYSAIGNHRESVRYLNKLLAAAPDDISLLMRLGNENLREGNYAEALKNFYNANFKDDNSATTARPLAWTLLLNGKAAEAEKALAYIPEEQRTANDWLNYGHAATAMRHYGDAVARYRRTREKAPEDSGPEWLADSIRADLAQVPDVPQSTDISLLIDALYI